MKYSLSSRQPKEYLEKADEIRVAYRDRNFILDIVELYPEADINLRLRNRDETYDWDEIVRLNTLAKGKLIVSCAYLSDVEEAKKLGLRCAWIEPARTFRELRGLAALGVDYILLDAPLFFDLERVKAFGVPLRVCANVASYDWFSFAENICGPWIRPEDVSVYEPYITTIEFALITLEQERALFRIYAEGQGWDGDISTIIPAIGTHVSNYMIMPELARNRIHCRQRCMANGACRLCYNAMDLAGQKDKLKEIANERKTV